MPRWRKRGRDGGGGALRRARRAALGAVVGGLVLGCGGAREEAGAGSVCAEITFGPQAEWPFDAPVRVALDPVPTDTTDFCPDGERLECFPCCDEARGTNRLRMLGPSIGGDDDWTDSPLRAWRPLPDERVLLKWSSGWVRIGIGMRALGPDSMLGHAWFGSDDPGSEIATSARAVRVPCDD